VVESLAPRGEDAKRYWDQLHALVAELDLVYLTGYVRAETASHYLTGADIGVLPFNHGPQEWFTPSSASPRSTSGSYCLFT